MQVGNDQGVMVKIESISPDAARELLARLDMAPAGIDQDKVRHFIDVIMSTSAEQGRWRPTLSTIWIDPDGTLRDGVHRLLACAITGEGVDVLVCRGAEWTAVRQLQVDEVCWAATTEGKGPYETWPAPDAGV